MSYQLRLFSPHGLSARSPTAQFDEFDYSTQAMQPKSQISSGYSAHKASAPGAQQLSLTSSTTLQRPCSLRVRSAQAIQPTRPQYPGAQQLSLKSSTIQLRPRSPMSQFSSSSQPTEPQRPNLKGSTTQLKQFSPKGLSTQ